MTLPQIICALRRRATAKRAVQPFCIVPHIDRVGRRDIVVAVGVAAGKHGKNTAAFLCAGCRERAHGTHVKQRLKYAEIARSLAERCRDAVAERAAKRRCVALCGLEGPA